MDKVAKKKAAEELLDRIHSEKDDIAGLDVVQETRLVLHNKIRRATQELEFYKLQDIEKIIVSEREPTGKKLSNGFVMGVITPTGSSQYGNCKLQVSRKNPSLNFVKFKITDLQKYKTKLVAKIKSGDFTGETPSLKA